MPNIYISINSIIFASSNIPFKNKEVWVIQKGGENRLSEPLATTTSRCARCQYLILVSTGRL
jgi:hypothetical protein